MTTLRTLAHVRHHGMDLTDLEFVVPLDHDRPAGESLTIFARAVKDSEHADAKRPWLVFLQGGPGFAGPRPFKKRDWLKPALADYHVLLLDSRGNGRSSVVLPQTLALRGDARAQADYLMHFRADSIVKDAESIRRELVGEKEPWSVLGQSYGGFCAVITVGPPARSSRGLHHRRPAAARRPAGRLLSPHLSGGRAQDAQFFARYPQDRELCARIMEHCIGTTSRCRRAAGSRSGAFSSSASCSGFDDGMEKLHYLLEGAFCRGAGGDELSLPFLRALENSQSFETNPIFAILHEMCYTQGAASHWSAQRVRGEFPDMDWAPGRPPSLTGEMIYPWMFDDYPRLAPAARRGGAPRARGALAAAV